jgi:hypothetical protein
LFLAAALTISVSFGVRQRARGGRD